MIKKSVSAVMLCLLFLFTLFLQTGCNLDKRYIEDDETIINQIDPIDYDEASAFPYIYIETDNRKNVESKDEYLSCVVRLDNCEEQYNLYGDDGRNAQIKGRGNSSWFLMSKKSYTLKFNTRIDLFGFGKAKKYTLIANHSDKSLSRNFIAYSLASKLGLQETSCVQPINLVLNGIHRGVYLLCEQVEIGKNRIDIDGSLDDIDTGYIIELDQRAINEGELNVDYFVLGEGDEQNYYALKDPKSDDDGFTPINLIFINDYMSECFDAIHGDSYERVEELIDVDSFARCYIVQEIFNNVDVGFSSFFFYKDRGGKLFNGPVWDFDISSGNCSYTPSANDPNYLYAKNSNIWYKKLLEFEEFENLVKNIFTENLNIIQETIDDVVSYQMEYKANNEINFVIWKIMGKWVYPNPDEIINITTFEGQLEFLENWLKSKIEYMKTVYFNH